MSKVVNEITATRSPLGRKRVIHQNRLLNDVFSVRDEINKSASALIETEYRIQVTLGSSCWIQDDLNISGDTVNQAVQRTQRQVIEAIFGEFRTDFRLIERALYDRDVESARIAFHELEHKMFNVTPEDN